MDSLQPKELFVKTRYLYPAINTEENILKNCYSSNYQELGKIGNKYIEIEIYRKDHISNASRNMKCEVSTTVL